MVASVQISDFKIGAIESKKKIVPIFSVFELREKEYSKIPSTKGEFLVVNDENVSYQIDAQKSNWDKSFQVATFSVSEILEDLKKKMLEHPGDHSKWTATISNGNNNVTLTFAGIGRVYRLKSVNVPKNSTHRKHKQYDNGHAPMFRIYIDKNGDNVGQIQVKNTSWQIDFPRTDDNLWEIRVGTKDSYLIRLRDWNTNLREHPVMERGDIKPEDFSQGTITEQLGPLETSEKAVRFVFEPAEETIIKNNGKEIMKLIWDGIKWYYRLEPIIIVR